MDSCINTNLKVFEDHSHLCLFVNMPKAPEESVANPKVQLLVRCQLAALQPSLFNMENVLFTDFGPTVLLTRGPLQHFNLYNLLLMTNELQKIEIRPDSFH